MWTHGTVPRSAWWLRRCWRRCKSAFIRRRGCGFAGVLKWTDGIPWRCADGPERAICFLGLGRWVRTNLRGRSRVWRWHGHPALSLRRVGAGESAATSASPVGEVGWRVSKKTGRSGPSFLDLCWEEEDRKPLARPCATWASKLQSRTVPARVPASPSWSVGRVTHITRRRTRSTHARLRLDVPSRSRTPAVRR